MESKTIERFWGKVKKTRKCWEWVGSKNPHGYGGFRYKGKLHSVHRISWMIHNGPIPKGSGYHGICVLHKCDNTSCVNPKHLFLGTHKDNIQDRNEKGRMADTSEENNGRCKLKKNQVEKIKEIYKLGMGTKLAKRFGVSRATIQDIIHNRSWIKIQV